MQTNLTNDILLHVLSLSPNAAAIYTTENLVIEMANDAMIAMWGKDKSIIGMTFEEAVPELKSQPFAAWLKEVWKTGISYNAKSKAARIKVNGVLSVYYIDFTYQAIKNKEGKTYCILHTAIDVTERVVKLKSARKQRRKQRDADAELAIAIEAYNKLQQVNESLINSEQNTRLTLLNAPFALGILRGRNLVIESANEDLVSLWGKGNDVTGKLLTDVLPEMTGQPFLSILDTVFTSGNPYYGQKEKAVIEHEGNMQEGYFNFVYQPIADKSGQTACIMVVANEVTEQYLSYCNIQELNENLSLLNEKLQHTNRQLTSSNQGLTEANDELAKAQQSLNSLLGKLTNSEEKLRQAIEAANLETWSVDMDLTHILLSERAKQIFGLVSEDEHIPVAKATEAVDEEYRAMMTDAIQKAMHDDQICDIEYPVTNLQTKERRWIRGIGKLFYTEPGEPSHFSGVLQDITERKQDEQRKNDFIAMVSHELKTPLTSLKALLQLLAIPSGQADNEFGIAVLTKADVQINKMTNLINGFLNLSRLEAGKIVLDKQNIDIEELVKEIVEECQMLFPSYHIGFTNCASTLVQADRDKIGQVINNFISNAVKYAPESKMIDIRCSANNHHVQISVTDYGKGIQPGDTDKLFERFYRVQNSHTNITGGFGIGLYLCSEIIKRHDGSIWVDSKLNKGSTFYFSLPLL